MWVAMRSKGSILKERSDMHKGKASVLLIVLILAATFLMAAAPVLQAGITPMTSGNACSCHGSSYTEYVHIDNYSIPSQINISQTLTVRVNVTMDSTAYDPAKSSYWISDLTVTVTSVNNHNTVKGSPKTNNSLLPTFTREYLFTITGSSAGQDTIKIEAKITTHHIGNYVTDTVQGNVLVIKLKEPPVLSNGKVTPLKGYNQTFFTFSVTYSDGDGDLPASINVIIDGKAPKALKVTDGNADNILSGEDYSTKFNGTNLGIGNHNFKFTAADNLFDATGDLIVHQGPLVDIYIPPNKPPTVVVTSPKTGAHLLGIVNITGTAVDPDAGDKVQSVEVNFDNLSWVKANGTAKWYQTWDCSNMTTGSHAIFARATDGNNYSKPVVTYVHIDRIIRMPPTVNFTGYHYMVEDLMVVSGVSAPGNNSGIVEKVAIWADPLHTWVTVDRKGPDLGNGTLSFDSWSWVWNTSQVDQGVYTLNAKAWSGSLISSIVNLDVTVIKINHRPAITTTEPADPVTMYEGGMKTFKVTTVDRDSDLLTNHWTIDTIPKQSLMDPMALTYKASYTSAGNHLVTIMVSDGHDVNGTVNYTWHLTVLKGFIITDNTVLPTGPIDSGQAQTFNVSVFDPEGGKKSYAWTIDGVKDATGVGPSYRFLYEAQSTQQTKHTITLNVQNSQAQSKDLTWTVDVKGKAPMTNPGGGNGNTASGADAQVIPWLLVVVVIIAVVFVIYVSVRRSKGADQGAVAQTDASIPPPAPAGMPPMQDPTMMQTSPVEDPYAYQYQGQDPNAYQYQAQEPAIEQPPPAQEPTAPQEQAPGQEGQSTTQTPLERPPDEGGGAQ
jgi:hypothetical protein